MKTIALLLILLAFEIGCDNNRAVNRKRPWHGYVVGEMVEIQNNKPHYILTIHATDSSYSENVEVSWEKFNAVKDYQPFDVE